MEQDFLDSGLFDFLGSDMLLTGLFALATLDDEVCKKGKKKKKSNLHVVKDDILLSQINKKGENKRKMVK